MTSISKNITFYITLVDTKNTDNSFLRKVIHSVLPQAIVDSIYGEEEVTQYFNNFPAVPDLIFLAQDMLKVAGMDTIQLIKKINGLEQVPLIFLTNVPNKSQRTDLITEGEGHHIYSQPFGAQDLLNIVGSVNRKWLA